MKKVLVCISMLGLSGLLFGCSTPEPDSAVEIETLAVAKGLDGNPLINPAEGNCPADEFDMPGEGWRAKGSSGGITPQSMFVAPAGYGSNHGVASSSLSDYYDEAQNHLKKDKPVLIIVDDFGAKDNHLLGSGVFDLADTSTWLSSATAAVAGTNLTPLDWQLMALEDADELSHGALVFNHFNALFGNFMTFQGVSKSGEASYQNGNLRLTVDKVNTHGMTTEQIKNAVYQAFQEAKTEKRSRIIVNMSFAIVSCSITDDFEANREIYPTFEEYAQAVANANAGLNISDVTELIVHSGAFDVFGYDFIASNQTFARIPVTYVAASGNYGLSYPMYPAAEVKVFDVASLDATNYDKSFFTNFGKQKATGAWHVLENPNNINGNLGSFDELVYAGTSFASPLFAAMEAATDNAPAVMAAVH